MNVFFTN